MKFIKIANPLPPANYPELNSFQKGLKEELDESIYDDIEDPEGKLDFLGSGAVGMAYTSEKDPNKVVKYTVDSSEIKAAEYIYKLQQENGGFLPHLTGLYEFSKIPNSDKIVRLVTEKVNPLNPDEAKIASAISYSDNEPRVINKHKRRNPQFVKEYMDLRQWLINNKFGPEDLRGPNLGRRDNGQLVLLDYGYLY